MQEKASTMQQQYLNRISGLRIRTANCKDIPHIAGLEKDIFSRPWSKESYESELHNPLSWLLVAENTGGDEIRGVICFRIILDEGYILKLYVGKNYRERGIGSLLLSCCEDICRRLKAGKIILDVDTGNTRGIKLYEKAGFVHKTSLKSVSRQIIMTKQLMD